MSKTTMTAYKIARICSNPTDNTINRPTLSPTVGICEFIGGKLVEASGIEQSLLSLVKSGLTIGLLEKYPQKYPEQRYVSLRYFPDEKVIWSITDSSALKAWRL